MKKITTKTAVKNKLFGGTEVKQKEVTEQGDRTRVKETKTSVKSDGTLGKRETTVKVDKIRK